MECTLHAGLMSVEMVQNWAILQLPKNKLKTTCMKCETYTITYSVLISYCFALHPYEKH